MKLPSAYRLNGADYFLLTLDHMMRRASDEANVCRLTFSLEGELTAEALEQALAAHPIFSWLYGLRLRGGFAFSLPRWVDTGSRSIKVGALEDKTSSLNPRREAPIHFDLIQNEGQTTIYFSWHHALTDAHGAEMLIQHLGGTLEVTETEQVLREPAPPHHALQHRASALKLKEHMDAVLKPPFTTLYRKSRSKPVTVHHTIRLSEEETAASNQAAVAAGAVMNRSGFYFAVAARAVSQVHQSRGNAPLDIALPLPQDRRKRGGVGPLIGNQVTFLFYRVSAEVLVTLKDTVKNLGEQGMSLMREQAPERYVHLMDISRYLPMGIYRRMIAHPSKGGMASFFFSDTGDSLNGFDSFMDYRIIAASHQPPNMVPPGVTFIFSKVQNRLQCSIATLQDQLHPEELQQLQDHIRRELTTVPDDAN